MPVGNATPPPLCTISPSTFSQMSRYSLPGTTLPFTHSLTSLVILPAVIYSGGIPISLDFTRTFLSSGSILGEVSAYLKLIPEGSGPSSRKYRRVATGGAFDLLPRVHV